MGCWLHLVTCFGSGSCLRAFKWTDPLLQRPYVLKPEPFSYPPVVLPMGANRTALVSPSQERSFRFFFNLGFQEFGWLALKNGRNMRFRLNLPLAPTWKNTAPARRRQRNGKPTMTS